MDSWRKIWEDDHEDDTALPSFTKPRVLSSSGTVAFTVELMPGQIFTVQNGEARDANGNTWRVERTGTAWNIQQVDNVEA